MNPITLALWSLFLPAGAALLLVLVPQLRKAGLPAALIAVTSSLVSFVCALLIVVRPEAVDARRVVPWIVSGATEIAHVGVNLDGVSAPMLVVVTLVALCVQIFSVAYMHDEKPAPFGRYFTLHALFLFAMNTLVLAPNLLQLFMGWELVGLTSYLLIGFWFEKPSAAKAAVKAFWMTKLGDMGFLFALLMLFVTSGTFAFNALLPDGIATWVTALLFFAVVGKSAQFPLHVWLPDAMEGPTPVSALLHAATMVAAGVFMVVRAEPLFLQSEATRTLMLWVGASTAVFAACLALVQNDIKKVLAYSTCSQLGYMVAALGAGSAFAGFFHLGTHAFFKALLFLAAGSVIHAVHSNLLSDMGGLRKKLPVTTGAFVIGALSLAGFPLLAGFFSKDLVLTALEGKAGWVPWAMLMGSAFLTAFYMGRVLIKAFWGPVSAKAEHAHEAGVLFDIPLAILSALALSAGFLGPKLAWLNFTVYEAHFVGLTPIAATVMALGGLGAAIAVFGKGGKAPLAGAIERLDAAAYVDRAWAAGYREVLGGVSRVSGWVDRYLIDGLVNLSGWATIEAAEGVKKVQTGKIRDYVMVLGAGALALVFWAALR
jgi:NADH-quinone oxidoreductase subunit L